MTYREIEGNLFDIGFPALAHGCNCKGVMGAGIALAFRRLYPRMYQEYREFCYDGDAVPGDYYPFEADNGTVIFNLLTQPVPGPTAEVIYIKKSLSKAIVDCKERGIAQMGIPRIGAGNGGLKWSEVREALLELVEFDDEFELVVVSLTPDGDSPHPDVMHLSSFPHRLYKVDKWDQSSSGAMVISASHIVKDPQDADIITSLIVDNSPKFQPLAGYQVKANKELHTVMLDLDVPATLIPSTTLNHSHLYIDVPVPWEDYVSLLDLLMKVKILEKGYTGASKSRGFTSLRLPWVHKLCDMVVNFDMPHRYAYTGG